VFDYIFHELTALRSARKPLVFMFNRSYFYLRAAEGRVRRAARHQIRSDGYLRELFSIDLAPRD